jgi:ribose 5-phosphate isomerase B
MTVYIGADHGGFELKQEIIKYLSTAKVAVKDCGNFAVDPNDNFTDFVAPVVQGVLKDGGVGILLCGTGIGISIAANHYKGIRAALVHSVEYAKLSRMHNDANVLCMGGRFMDKKTAVEIVEMFLNTKLDGNPKYKNRMNIADGGA